MSQWTTDCDKPIKMCQPLSWAVTIFVATDPSVKFYFASSVYPSRLAISGTEIFTFVDCFRLISDRLGDFAQSLCSHSWTQMQIASESFLDALL